MSRSIHTCLTIGGKPFGYVTVELSVTCQVKWYPVTSESVMDAWGGGGGGGHFTRQQGRPATILSGASRVLANATHQLENWGTVEANCL